MIRFLFLTPSPGFLSVVPLPKGSVAFNAACDKGEGCKAAEHLQKWSLCSIVSTCSWSPAWHSSPGHRHPGAMTLPLRFHGLQQICLPIELRLMNIRVENKAR